MSLTEQDVRYVADLANLQLTEPEISAMARHLSAILEHMEALNEIDVSGIEPMRQVLFTTEENTLRADDPRPTLPNAEALANAPQSGGGYFRVPRVIER